MFHMGKIVFELETDDSLQNLINNLSKNYANDIEYLNSKNNKVYVVFRDNHSTSKRSRELLSKNYVSEVNKTKTLFGRMLRFIFGTHLYEKLNPTVSVNQN